MRGLILKPSLFPLLPFFSQCLILDFLSRKKIHKLSTQIFLIMKKIKFLLTLLPMILCLFIGSDAIAQKTDKQMPKITSSKAYNTSIIASQKKPLDSKGVVPTEAISKTKGAKVVIHPVSADTQRKALEARLERLENSNLTSEQKTIIREKIQTRLNNLK